MSALNVKSNKNPGANSSAKWDKGEVNWVSARDSFQEPALPSPVVSNDRIVSSMELQLPQIKE